MNLKKWQGALWGAAVILFALGYWLYQSDHLFGLLVVSLSALSAFIGNIADVPFSLKYKVLCVSFRFFYVVYFLVYLHVNIPMFLFLIVTLAVFVIEIRYLKQLQLVETEAAIRQADESDVEADRLKAILCIEASDPKGRNELWQTLKGIWKGGSK